MRRSLFILALLLAACGGDGNGPAPPDGGGGVPVIQHVPVISNLTLMPDSVTYMSGDGQVTVKVTLGFSDAGKDIQTLWVEMPDGATSQFAEVSIGATGTLSEQLTMSTKTVGTFTIEAWLVDKAGDVSNHISGTFDVVADVPVSSWIRRLDGLPYALNDVTWNGTRFIAVGDGGQILTSADGIDWSPQQSNTTADLFAVASQGLDIVAVGYDSIVLASTDGGATWNFKHGGQRVRLAAVAIDAPTIVAGGMDLNSGNAYIIRSVDLGTSWRAASSLPQSGHFITDLLRTGNLFVAATDVFSSSSDARVMVSSDGDIWNEIVLRSEVAASYAIVHDGQKFIAAGSHQAVFASPDGYNWTEGATPVDRVDYFSAAWNGSSLVVAGGITWWYWWIGPPAFERPAGLSSTDGGATWELFDIDGYYQSNGLAWGSGRFVSVGQASPISAEGRIYTSN